MAVDLNMAYFWYLLVCSIKFGIGRNRIFVERTVHVEAAHLQVGAEAKYFIADNCFKAPQNSKGNNHYGNTNGNARNSDLVNGRRKRLALGVLDTPGNK